MLTRTTTGLAAAAAGIIVLGTLVGCNSGTGTASSSRPTGSLPAAGFNVTDVAFAGNMITFNRQAGALAAIVPGHADRAEIHTMAGHMSDYGGDDGQIRGWMHDWHQTPPLTSPTSSTTPWPWSGPGMMDSGSWHGWDDMDRMNGHGFDATWVDAAIAVNNAVIAQCHTELAGGINPQARALAGHTLTQRQADLVQLQSWHDSWAHD